MFIFLIENLCYVFSLVLIAYGLEWTAVHLEIIIWRKAPFNHKAKVLWKLSMDHGMMHQMVTVF